MKIMAESSIYDHWMVILDDKMPNFYTGDLIDITSDALQSLNSGNLSPTPDVVYYHRGERVGTCWANYSYTDLYINGHMSGFRHRGKTMKEVLDIMLDFRFSLEDYEICCIFGSSIPDCYLNRGISISSKNNSIILSHHDPVDAMELRLKQ